MFMPRALRRPRPRACRGWRRPSFLRWRSWVSAARSPFVSRSKKAPRWLRARAARPGARSTPPPSTVLRQHSLRRSRAAQDPPDRNQAQDRDPLAQIPRPLRLQRGWGRPSLRSALPSRPDLWARPPPPMAFSDCWGLRSLAMKRSSLGILRGKGRCRSRSTFAQTVAWRESPGGCPELPTSRFAFSKPRVRCPLARALQRAKSSSECNFQSGHLRPTSSGHRSRPTRVST